MFVSGDCKITYRPENGWYEVQMLSSKRIFRIDKADGDCIEVLKRAAETGETLALKARIESVQTWVPGAFIKVTEVLQYP